MILRPQTRKVGRDRSGDANGQTDVVSGTPPVPQRPDGSSAAGASEGLR